VLFGAGADRRRIGPAHRSLDAARADGVAVIEEGQGVEAALQHV